jgi:hypothetical protein
VKRSIRLMGCKQGFRLVGGLFHGSGMSSACFLEISGGTPHTNPHLAANTGPKQGKESKTNICRR